MTKITLKRAQRTNSPSRHRTWAKLERSPLDIITKAPQQDGLWRR